MILQRVSRPIRPGFTLVEMMVACALAVGLMWLLAESFKMGLDFTRHARSTGQMMGQLDGAGAILSRDISAEHFLPNDSLPNRGVRLGDQRLDLLTNASPSLGWTPPRGGFFRIISPTSNLVQTDSDGFSIFTATNHALHFTSVLSPSDRNLYSVNVGNTPFQSRAAEIAYFLVDSGQFTAPVGGQPLYHLVRKQRLAAVTDDERSALLGGVADTGVIAGNGTVPYSLVGLTDPANRLPINPPATSWAPLMFPISNARYGEDLLLSDVLSFEVRVDWSPNTNGLSSSSQAPRAFATNTEYPFDNLTVNTGHNSAFAGQGVFDTWFPAASWNINLNGAGNPSKVPLAVRVNGIQVTIRIWDRKTKQSRQNTWKFSM